MMITRRTPQLLRSVAAFSSRSSPSSSSVAEWRCTPALRRSLHTTSSRRSTTQLVAKCKKELKEIEEAGTYKHERIITSPQRSAITVRGSSAPVLNFCANNYLGLSDDARLIAAAKEGLDTHGMGLSSVRFICGTQDIHKQLEATMSEFHQLETLLGPEDAVVSDELNHASIIDGVRLCKAQRFRYKHADVGDLEAQLRSAKEMGCKVKLVVTDGVFSMDGNIAPLRDISDVCEKYDAVLMIDDCHGTGVIGKTGRGAPEYNDCMDRVDIINSTFGKALGGATGGYTSGPKEVIDLLRNRSRPYLFSNSLAPAVVACNIEAMNILMSSNELISKLQTNTDRFRSRMTAAGFTLSGKSHAIAPVMLGDARLASEMADDMLARGIYVIGFSYPVVPKGKARIRVQLSAAHTTEEIDRCVDSFIEVGKARNVIR